jgi:hypothetical protein
MKSPINSFFYIKFVGLFDKLSAIYFFVKEKINGGKAAIILVILDESSPVWSFFI